MAATLLREKKKKETSTNPFYGMRSTLTMLQQVSKFGENTFTKADVIKLISAAWQECKDDLEKRKLFFSLVISFGDITNRDHNLFKKIGLKNPDAGGHSLRKVFMYCMEWMHKNCTEQFYSFLPILGEYYNIGANTMLYTIKTDRFKGNIIEVFKVGINVDRLTTYIASVLKDPKTTENELALWAKWLWRIPLSSRRVRKFTDKKGIAVEKVTFKQDETLKKDKFVRECIITLSKKMDWEVILHPNNKQFVGYKEFRKKYLANTEAALFSSQKIKQMDKMQLLSWFDQLPSGARYRTQCRILDKQPNGSLASNKKWVGNSGVDIGDTFIDWVKSKEAAQEAIRTLSKEDKEKLSKENPKALKEMEKAAKVNTGATTIVDTVIEMTTGTKDISNLAAHSILEKIKLDVPVLVIADVSSSMSYSDITYKTQGRFTPRDMAAIVATTFLLKNPAEELSNLLLTFNNSLNVYHEGASVMIQKNKFMLGKTTTVSKLVDPKLDFYSNYQSVKKLLTTSGGTVFYCVADGLKAWVDSDPNMSSTYIEMINQYPVWVVVSDGDMNGSGSATETMASFKMKMLQYFGWDGVVVVWDVKNIEDEDNKFGGLENVMYFGGFNPAILNQVFLNIQDLDIIDVYTPLETIYRSNRYVPVRELVS